ncbi:hypothetical protein [Escherichia coli]|uniref:hypothetical protein n=1 Tax=Escherichia coli TaxID=562 RepID=UPI0022B0C837|nr:hypothetical protein [Escherichia coli]MCZ4179915.1 hypothetical protein [Escherichia coli]
MIDTMKTLSGKEFRKLFNRYETGFYLSEFEYLKDFDPLFPECVGKELKLGYKRKVDVWCEEDAALYAEFIATKERLKRGRLILKINQVWSRVYPAYIYAIEERINVRAKGRESFKYETVQEKQCKLSIMLDGLKDLECEIAMICLLYTSLKKKKKKRKKKKKIVTTTLRYKQSMLRSVE